MVLVDEDQLFQLLREAKENGQIDLLKRVLNVVNDLFEEQEASPDRPAISNDEGSEGTFKPRIALGFVLMLSNPARFLFAKAIFFWRISRVRASVGTHWSAELNLIAAARQ